MTRTLQRAALLLALAASLAAQNPEDPPPWWGYSGDDATVSLWWDFGNGANPLAPTAQVLPTWFSPPPGPGMFRNSPAVAWLPNVGGQAGAMGFTGAGTATISVLVDNDPQPTHTKTVFLQVDAFEGNGGSVVLELGKDLLKYKRRILEESSKPLGNGWTRITQSMELTPQPDSETIDFTLSGSAGGVVAIDDFYVNTHCDQYDGGKEGDALGEIDTTMLNLDLAAVTLGATCTAVAATESLAGTLTYWVAGRTTAGDQLFALDAAGALVAAPVPYPSGLGSIEGASDLAIAEFPQTTGTPLVFVYGVVDRRATNGTVDVFAVDGSSPVPVLVPARTIVTTAINGPGPLGLAFSRFSNGGQGAFWISDQAGTVTEIDLAGAPLRVLTPGSHNTPLGISGAAFDDDTGMFYWFSQAPRASALGPLRINGYVHDGWTFDRTEIEWIADRSFPSPFGPGGVARGCEILRRQNGEFRLLCVQQLGATSRLAVLKGPFQFGLGMLGRSGMSGGLPAFGNTQFQLTLRGCANGIAAICYLGFSNASTGGIPLPIDLSPLGLDESDLAIDPSMALGLQFLTNGTALQPLALPPPSAVFTNVPTCFQWLVLDPTVTAGMATSQAGETILY